MKTRGIMKLDQLAEDLDVTPRIIREWRKLGMPVIEIGKFACVIVPHFLKWLESFEIKKGGEGDEKQGSLLPGMRKI
jgi:hypothetical protein